MPGEINVVVSATETRQYRRIIEFVGAVHDHAESTDDAALREIVGALRDDLLGMALGE